GKRRPDLPGLFFEPTVLVDVTHDMDIMRDETFGPVIPIMRVRDEEEAIRLANDSRYGLDASVWTRDAARGARIARRIQSGADCVKQAVVIDRFGMNSEINWWPITPGKVRLFRRALDLFGSGWRRKFLGAPAPRERAAPQP